MMDDVRMFLRYARGLREYFRRPLSLEESYRVVEEQYQRREKSFLFLLEGSVFRNPQSPYLALLQRAGIAYADVAKWVQTDGLEPSLERLRDAGVYVSLNEFKGREPIVRSGLELYVQPKDFDNPCLRGHLEGRTGGSRGVPRRLAVDLDLLVYDAACQYLFLEGFGLTNRPMALWRPLPPDLSGIKKPLLHAKIRKPMLRWFTQDRLEYSPRRLKYAIFTQYTLLASRLSGISMPALEHVPVAQAIKVARWLAMQRASERPACLDTLVGCAVRVCLAAKESGLDIAGSFFRLGSEPYTPAKASVLQESGVRAGCFYAMAETGPVGIPCAEPEALDDVHLLSGKVALIQRAKLVRTGTSPVNTFHFTTLLPSTPKVMLNVESDDYGDLVKRRCSCPFGRLGLDYHLHTIRSYEKLTSEGVTFIGSDLFRLLDEILPRAVGGSPTDYQLVEEEVNGLPRVGLLISPRLGNVDEARVTRVVIEYLGRRDDGCRAMARLWKEGETLRILRREPMVTEGSKILPLHILKV